MKRGYIISLTGVLIIGVIIFASYNLNKNNITPNKSSSDTTQSNTISNKSSLSSQNSSTINNILSSLSPQSNSTSNNFLSSPSPQSRSTVPTSSTHRFVFIADTRGDYNGVNKPALAKILQLIKGLSPQPEYIITAGDLVGGADSDSAFLSQLQSFKSIFTAYYPINKILPGFGNHEDIGETNNSHDKIFQNFFNGFPETSSLSTYDNTAYYLDVGNVRLIMLNSDYQGQLHEIAGGQLDWFKNCMKTGNKMIKFAFVHEPPYPTGANIGYSLDVHPAQRDSFWQVIDNNNVMTLFCGHEHNYSRRIIDKSFSSLFTRPVNQVIAGTAGAPLYPQYTSKKGVVVPPNPVYHFAIIDVGQSTTTITAISIDSKVIDQFTLQNIY
jgi:Icc protein